MQLHKNKILIFSAVYIASLIVIASIFAMWHNAQLAKGPDGYLIFLLLLLALVAVISFFYLAVFRSCRKEIEEKTAAEASALIEANQESEIVKEDEYVKESFDKKAFIESILPGNTKSIDEFCEETLRKLAAKLAVVQGIFYLKTGAEETFEPVSLYAYYSDKTPPRFKSGETLPGQALKDKRILIVQNIPENYVPVTSGLGSGKPKTLVLIPVIAENDPVGLIEIAVFSSVEGEMEPALKELGAIIGKKIIKLMN